VAGYINKIQYVALLMMVAGHCKYKVGKFCHLTQNLHIYDRHFDAVDVLLIKQPIDIQPELILIDNIFQHLRNRLWIIYSIEMFYSGEYL
jgi:thymidylate synthase